MRKYAPFLTVLAVAAAPYRHTTTSRTRQLGLAPPGTGLLPPGEADVFAGRA